MTVLLVLLAVILFGFIIFIHEFGHFFTAKLSGITVNEFAIGMGPQLFSFTKGETKYTLRLFPIGGYCAMEGEDEESPDEGAFNNKPVWKRMIVVVAGAAMNIILGLVLMCVIVCCGNLIATNQIAAFSEGSRMEAAGAQVGDYVVSIDGYKIRTETDLSFALGTADPESVDVVLNRNGEIILLENIQLDSYETSQGSTAVVIDFNIYGLQKNPIRVIKKSFANTWSMMKMVVMSLKGLITGQFGLNEVSGPVGVAQVITEAASTGLKTGVKDALLTIITIMSLISVNLGVFNLLPFPALDGGRFVFLLIEAIRKKPVPRKYEAWVNGAGMVLLLALMAVITLKDVVGLFK
ncbi:MAG: RIP metalloprotease RseP [Clostridia bacterium]|nr:RIP metalloprotease RseP [Clostridia bacterium]